MLEFGVPFPLLPTLGAVLPILVNILSYPGAYPFGPLPSDTELDRMGTAFWCMKWLPISWVVSCWALKKFKGGPRGDELNCSILSICGAAVLATGLVKGIWESVEGKATAADWFLNVSGGLVTLAKPLSFIKPEGLVALVVIDYVGDAGAGIVTYVYNS
jgi:hypothetical protein